MLKGPELILIFLAIVLLFGASRLPQLGGAIGQAIKNFKKGFNDQEETPSKTSSLEQGKEGSTPSPSEKAKQNS